MTEVLAVAKIHPFYNPNVVYPADTETIQRVRGLINKEEISALQAQPLLSKKTL